MYFQLGFLCSLFSLSCGKLLLDFLVSISRTNIIKYAASKALNRILRNIRIVNQLLLSTHSTLIQVVFAVAVSAELLIDTLLFFEMPQQNFKGLHQRQGCKHGSDAPEYVGAYVKSMKDAMG